MSQQPLYTVLRQLRLSQGVSQRSVADHLGLSSASLSNKEKGRLGITQEQIEDYAAFLGYELTLCVKR